MAQDESTRQWRAERRQKQWTRGLWDLAKMGGVLLAASLLGVLFYTMEMQEGNIIAVYILAVMACALVTTSSACGVVASLASVLIFNFLFTEPRYTLHAYDPEYPITFAVMFVIGILAGSLAARLKNHAAQTTQAAHRTQILFETNQLLQQARDKDAIVEITAHQLTRLLERDVVFYSVTKEGHLGESCSFPAGETPLNPRYLTKTERSAAQLTLDGVDRYLPDTKCVYIPIRSERHTYGVVGVAVDTQSLDSYDSSMLLSILGECGLALENQRNAAEKEEAAVLAKQEQLRANLLRTISHDLRTPLTSISGNASNLISNGDTFDQETKTQIYKDIYDDSLWLINLVENLLAVSRVEGDSAQLRLSTELLDDVIDEALNHVDRRRSDYRITVDTGGHFFLVRVDARLIIQVIINLVNNAIKYTPTGSEIRIEARQAGGMVEVSVSDNGPGVDPEIRPHIFEMFYSGANHLADSHRSLGLGLALCRSIVLAHGGDITLDTTAPQGARFTFTVPAGEVTIHE